MKTHKMYEPGDTMISLMRDNYAILQSLGAFGISIGFGDKTVNEVCQSQNVDTTTFLVVVNFTINGFFDPNSLEQVSVPTLLHYLKASHKFYLDFELPFIRRELADALDPESNLAALIMRLYDEYANSIRIHMKYEEKMVFPYVEQLLNHSVSNYTIDTYSKHHGQTDRKLKELKEIIIKYLPADDLHNNQLTATLYDIYNCEEWLTQHARVEDEIFIPVIRRLEQHVRQHDLSQKITSLISQQPHEENALSDREREVIIGVVQGMTNKEIAEHLFISVNTVITHRRNIARKLQIHSPAGLTIYAIVNKLIDINAVKL